MHACMHTYIHTYICSYMYIYIHMYTNIPKALVYGVMLGFYHQQQEPPFSRPLTSSEDSIADSGPLGLFDVRDFGVSPAEGAPISTP